MLNDISSVDSTFFEHSAVDDLIDQMHYIVVALSAREQGLSVRGFSHQSMIPFAAGRIPLIE